MFHEDARGHSAHVFYKLKAEVHVPGLFKSNIKHTQRLVVHEGLFSEVRPIAREAQSRVTQCCCIDKGTAQLRATFDKNAYVPGETARVVCEVDNQSSLRLRHIRSKLKRRLTLHDNSGRRHQMVDTLAQGTYEGVDPFTACTGDEARFVPLLLANNTREPVQPQTHGRLVTCDYWVEVELDVPMGSDINVVLETTIYAPIPVPEALVAPPVCCACARACRCCRANAVSCALCRGGPRRSRWRPCRWTSPTQHTRTSSQRRGSARPKKTTEQAFCCHYAMHSWAIPVSSHARHTSNSSSSGRNGNPRPCLRPSQVGRAARSPPRCPHAPPPPRGATRASPSACR